MTISSVGGTGSSSLNPINTNKVDTVENLLQQASVLTAQYQQRLAKNEMINYPPDRLATFVQQVTTLENFAAEPNAAQRIAAIPGATLELAGVVQLATYNSNQCQAQIDKYGVADYSKSPLSDELGPLGTITTDQTLMGKLITLLKNNGF